MQQIWLFQDISIFSKGGHCVMEVGAWSYTILKRDHSITIPAQFGLNLFRDRSQNLGASPLPPSQNILFTRKKKEDYFCMKSQYVFFKAEQRFHAVNCRVRLAYFCCCIFRVKILTHTHFPDLNGRSLYVVIENCQVIFLSK